MHVIIIFNELNDILLQTIQHRNVTQCCYKKDLSCHLAIFELSFLIESIQNIRKLAFEREGYKLQLYQFINHSSILGISLVF